MRIRRLLFALLSAAALLASNAAWAQYKCVRAGQTHYQDRPCDGEPKQAPLALNVPSGFGEARSSQSAALRRMEAQRQSRVDQAITQNQPVVGMRANELDAALGSPTRRNYSASGDSESNQLIYERGGRTWYVYTGPDGTVNSVQNSATIGAPRMRAPRPRDTLVQH